MKFKDVLKEEYADTAKVTYSKISRDKFYDIFKNPARKEIVELTKNGLSSIRVIIDIEKEIFYAFSYELLYEYAAKKLGYKYPADEESGKVVFARAAVTPSKLQIKSDFFVHTKIPDWVKKKFKVVYTNSINKEYVNTYKGRYYGTNIEHTHDIFKNPTRKECTELVKEYGKSLRVIIDLVGKAIYVFSADLLHSKASKLVGINYPDDDYDEAIFTTCVYENNKLKINERFLPKDIPEWLLKFVTPVENLNEELQFIKFHYDNYKNDKRPRVKALDFEYPGKEGQKTYGQRKDILGWNLNYYKNPKEAKRTIDEIDSFARLLDVNKKDKYNRLKDFFPDQFALIRRYMRKHIKGLKRRDGWRWKPTTYDQLIQFDKEAF